MLRLSSRRPLLAKAARSGAPSGEAGRGREKQGTPTPRAPLGQCNKPTKNQMIGASLGQERW